jgi:fructose-1,6-bisphosphatase/inositol monophosphatase family enzyme
MTDLQVGKVNGHIVGRLLKETLRRAMVVIRNETLFFEAQVKESYSGTMDDVVTSADKKAQDIYIRAFRECFPDCGIIGEEDSLMIAPQNGCLAYFTVDPLDGTKAYVRRQSHGVSSMVALVNGSGVVISAYIGDVNTDEVYGYRPDSKKVFRITRQDSFEELRGELHTAHARPSLDRIQCLLRDPLEKYSWCSKSLVGMCKNYEVMGSSIGTWMARLWKNEVSAVLIQPGWETPWDSTPVIGISKVLGYVYLRPVNTYNSIWEVYEPEVIREKKYRSHDTLVIHASNLHLLKVK